MSEPVPALSLGAIFGGVKPPIEDWRGVWRHTSQLVSRLRVGHQSPLSLNVVFHFAGEVLTPEFTGLRTARYSRREKTLMIQVAMPEGLPPREAILRLLDLTEQAIDLAEEFAFARKIIDEPLDVLRRIVLEARAAAY